MLEFLIELIATFVFEILVELFAPLGRWLRGGQESESRGNPWSPAVQQNRTAVIAKLLLGAAAGGAWGYYVNRSTNGEWPRTFWTFAIMGVLAWGLHLGGASNERFASRIGNQYLRGLITFTPQRFANWAKLSGVTAVAVAIGFFLAG